VPVVTHAAPSLSPAGQFADWPVYHGDVAHSGVASGAGIGFPAAAWTSPALDADDHGEPIIAGGRVIAATENNTVYAFSAAGGHQLWSTHLATPESSSRLPCGDISPVSGVTGAPVADEATGMVYVLAFLNSGTHELYALNLSSGSVAWSKAADAPGLNPLTEQQRSALVVANGMVYIAYGGLYGDCGSYHGAVVGIPASGSGSTISYVVPSQNQAGIWAPPGPSVDAAGNLFVATGNSSSSGAFDDANAVIRLTPTLQAVSSFAPANWESLNRADADLGSQSPVLLQGGYVFQAGKAGVGYVLSAASLGGVGGEVSSAQVCGGGAYSGTAYVAPTVYVACTSGVTAVTVSGSGAVSVLWHSSGFDAGAPIVADAMIWALDLSNNTLVELNPSSGATLASAPAPALPHFANPSVSGGLIFVAGLRSVEAFHA
jgi:outer membrane protein assembly factor BamB